MCDKVGLSLFFQHLLTVVLVLSTCMHRHGRFCCWYSKSSLCNFIYIILILIEIYWDLRNLATICFNVDGYYVASDILCESSPHTRQNRRSLTLQPAEIYMLYFSLQRIQKIYKLLTLHMTVDIHVNRSKILNGSRSTDVNTKYKQQQANNFNFLNSQYIPIWKVAVYIGFIQDRGKNY